MIAENEKQLAEIERLLADDWDYRSLERILRDELPLTLGLAVSLVERMVREGMFKDRVNGAVKAMRRAAEQALDDVQE
jgi:hypothetical protein